MSDHIGMNGAIHMRNAQPVAVKRRSNITGFTLLEVLLSVAVVAILAGVSVPLYQSFQIHSDLDEAAATFVHALRRAQTLAMTGSGDSMWGVAAQNGSITVFRGASYVLRGSSTDETFDVSPMLSITGVWEIVFSKVEGHPSVTGSTIFTSSAGEARTITINEAGTVLY